MRLSEKQAIFTKNVASLIEYATTIGVSLTFGEVYRTKDQQILYVTGKTFNPAGVLVSTKKLSKTMKSAHIKRLAVDFNVFVDGEYKTDKASYKTLGDYWKTLHPKNVWGGDWGWDSNHFEMKE